MCKKPKLRYAIDSDEKVVIDGEAFFLRIRSQDETNPVVLFLHGGPGSPDRAQTMRYQSPLAEYCTIVAWDQPGAGKAYAKEVTPEELTKERYVESAHRLTDYLKKRFRKEKIYLVAHSFGSQFALWVLEKYADDYFAYVGVGQFISSVRNEELSYDFTLREAQRRNDRKAMKKLREVGPPVDGFYQDGKVFVQRDYLHKYGGATYRSNKTFTREIVGMLPMLLEEYSIRDLIRYIKGIRLFQGAPLTRGRDDFIASVREVRCPVYLLLGHHDYNCPFALAEEWFENLQAPSKKLVWFENSAHAPQWEEPQLWNETFASLVLKTDDRP